MLYRRKSEIRQSVLHYRTRASDPFYFTIEKLFPDTLHHLHKIIEKSDYTPTVKSGNEISEKNERNGARQMLSYANCNLCPRKCGVDRRFEKGFCGCSDKIKIARAALHFWEEPCISGTNGSGAVFFSGCTLKCRYCQNHEISAEGFGKEITTGRLAEIFINLKSQGAHNINLVTADQYLPGVLEALDLVKNKLRIPVVYNCGGYESIETIKALDGYVDIFLPDFKYFSRSLSLEYSDAGDYFEVAAAAISQMIAQTGTIGYDKNGIMRKGVIIRHLVLPGARHDSIKMLRFIKKAFPENGFLLSLMSQYTPPESAHGGKLGRRITTFEYQSVIDEAVKLNLINGFMQEKSSAKEEYTPKFNLTGV